MSPHPLTPRKLPRVDLVKLAEGGAAGRRSFIDTLGDSLRELGAVRIEGWTVEGGNLGRVVLSVLEALEGYFGLGRGRLSRRAGTAAEGWAATEASLPPMGGPVGGLLAVMSAEGGDVELVTRDGEWMTSALRPGELLVLAGSGLARLTGDRVVGARVRPAAEAGQVPPVLLFVPVGEVEVVELPEFTSP